jgi:hypothetical protein
MGKGTREGEVKMMLNKEKERKYSSDAMIQ